MPPRCRHCNVIPYLKDVTPDKKAVYSFLIYEYLPGTTSGWQGVAKLEPSTILAAKDGHIEIYRYWRPCLERVGRGNHGEAEAADRLEQLISASVRDRVVADVLGCAPTGSSLTSRGHL